MGILAVGMTTCTIRAEVVDMGGFQIQIGQKPDSGMEQADLGEEAKDGL